MKLKPKVIHELAQFVFRQMSQEGRWTVKGDEGHITQAIQGVIEHNLKEEEELGREAKKLLEAQLAKARDVSIDEHKALQLIKKQLAKQKGMVL